MSTSEYDHETNVHENEETGEERRRRENDAIRQREQTDPLFGERLGRRAALGFR